MSFIKGTYLDKLINRAIDGMSNIWGLGDGHRPPHLHMDTMMEWQQDLDEDGVHNPPTNTKKKAKKHE
tara:strand:- start:61 stop:264 length:204 start_codon:yes stop_codon:yes gene_type:complete